MTKKVETTRRGFLQGVTALLGTSAINPAQAVEILTAPPPAAPPLPPAFTVFSEMIGPHVGFSDPPRTAFEKRQEQLERHGHNAGCMDALTAYGEEALAKGYKTYLAQDNEWVDDSYYTLKSLLGNVPPDITPEHVSSYTTTIQNFRDSLPGKLKGHFSEEEVNELVKAFDRSRSETRDHLLSGAEHQRRKVALTQRMLNTLEQAYGERIINLNIRRQEDSALRFHIHFDADQFPAEACHYMINTGENSARLPINEDIKAILDALRHNDLITEEGTKISYEKEFNNKYLNGHGGWITHGITITSSEPVIEELAKDTLNRMLRVNAKQRISQLIDLARVSHAGSRAATDDGPQSFTLVIDPVQKAVAEPLLQLQHEMSDILPGFEIRKIGNELRMSIGEEAMESLAEPLEMLRSKTHTQASPAR